MRGFLVLLLCFVAVPAIAQHAHPATPYAGQQPREIKALSDAQLADLREGRGMSQALPGELNGYPGPLHVLELADQLTLTADQKAKVQVLFDAMKAEAIALGNNLIEQERALDRAFAQQTISLDQLSPLTREIGLAQGRLREVHLKYHLATANLLSDHQRHRYAVLRGYR